MNVIENQNFEFPEELFEEREFGRLVSFSKNLGELTELESGPTKKSFPQIFGEYELVRLLGHSKICTTYLARHFDSPEQFALKKIAPKLVRELGVEEFARQFEQFRFEAGAIMAVDPTNVATVYDMGCVDGSYFYATRYVKGKNLAKFVKANLFSNRQAALTVKSIAESLHKLHQAGIVHRNLKPANIVLEAESPQPHLLEPESILLHSIASNECIEQTFRAPEVSEKLASIDAVAEVWSLGAILYNCLLGEPPSAEESIVPPRKRNPVVAKDLETICLKCLRTDRRQRYSDAAELAEDLELFLDYRPINASPSGLFGKLINKVSRLG